ncbi:rCG55227 [Rattus norvegicus]|uniref:RCG55227 n=1 Tax=Rattus norvegicus TaxID=10116 RepID=A6J820_RAT|nr:rCG55227 [Rattus norvegicus]
MVIEQSTEVLEILNFVRSLANKTVFVNMVG